MHAALAWQQADGRTDGRLRGKVGSLSLSLFLSLPTLFYPEYIFITKLLYSITRRGRARALKPARAENYDSDTFARARRNRRVFR